MNLSYPPGLRTHSSQNKLSAKIKQQTPSDKDLSTFYSYKHKPNTVQPASLKTKTPNKTMIISIHNKNKCPATLPLFLITAASLFMPVLAQSPELTSFGWSPTKTLQACEGDCDNDNQCAGDLKCFQRDDRTAVPGCSGPGVDGWDYCVYPPNPAATPTASPTATPTANPTNTALPNANTGGGKAAI
jgi:hypothetical protein